MRGCPRLFVFIENGVVPVAALGNHLLDVVEEIVQMEALQPFPAANTIHGNGVVDEPGGAHGVKGRGDDARLRGNIAKLLGELRLADDEAADVFLHGTPHHLRLIAADDDGILAVEEQVFPGLGQGDAHFTGDHVHEIAVFVENLSLQHAQEVEHRNTLSLGAGGDLHVKVGDLRGGHHAEEVPLLVGDGDAGDIVVGLERLPGAGNGHAGSQGRGHVVVQVAHLGAHGADEHRRLKIKSLQDAVGFVADMSQAGSHKLPVAQRVAQCRVGDGRHDGICVRVAVAGYIDRIQESSLLFRN